jgi:hypothetical protein
MIKAMPCKPLVAVWMALLSTCRTHGNLEMGEHVAKLVLELKPENSVGYGLLSNIYAVARNKDICEYVEQQRKDRGVRNKSSLGDMHTTKRKIKDTRFYMVQQKPTSTERTHTQLTL